MKLKELIAVRKLIVKHKDDAMPSCVAYKLMKIMKASDSDEAFYNEKIRQMLDQYSLKDEEGKSKMVDGDIAIEPAKMAEFNQKILEVQDIEVETPNVQLSIDELESVRLTVSELYTLDEFIAS